MTTSSAARPPHFRHPSAGEPLTDDILAAYFRHQTAVFSILSETGMEYIQDPKPMERKEWWELFQTTYYAWDGLESQYVQKFFDRVVEKGIEGIAHFIETTTMSAEELKQDVYERGPVIGQWMADIMYQLDVARIKDEGERRRLVVKFAEVCVAVSRKMKADCSFFDSLARQRFPRDEAAQQMWLKELRTSAGLS